MTTSCPGLPKVVVADLAEVTKPDVPRVPSDFRQYFIHKGNDSITATIFQEAWEGRHSAPVPPLVARGLQTRGHEPVQPAPHGGLAAAEVGNQLGYPHPVSREPQDPAPVPLAGLHAVRADGGVAVSQLNSPSRASVVQATNGANHWHIGVQFVPRRIGQTDRATDRCCNP